jgi:CBS domain containing-hemolysin-like protein
MVRVGDNIFEVLSMDGHRVDQVRVTRDATPAEEDG